MFIALFFQVAASRAGAQTAPASPQSPPAPRLDIYGFVMTDFGYDFMQNNPNWFDGHPADQTAFVQERVWPER
jgi:hypothetical protein